MTSIVLAGGRGSRLGREKHGEVIAGQGIIDHTISILSTLSSEILLVISRRQSQSSFPTYRNARMVFDLVPGKGSLGGIYTGLTFSSSFHSLVVACDMPFINPQLLQYMAELAPGFDVVIPRTNGNMEPLHAIYSKKCIKPIEELMAKDILRITDILSTVSVRYVEKSEIDRFDPKHLSFFNVNTQADLQRARKLAAEELSSRRGEKAVNACGNRTANDSG